MFLIPGPLISILTFPGVIVHEISHRFFADIARVPVYEVCYFKFGNPSGYVIHGSTKTLKQSFLISVGPLIINSILCMLLTFAAIYPIVILNCETYNPLFIFLLWVGISIGMHAFPSNQDAQVFVKSVKDHKGKSLLWIISATFSFIIKIANLLRILWFDLFYAIIISVLLPKVVSFI